MSRFQILFAGNIGHPANCGPVGGGGGGGGAGVAVGAGREAVGWGLAVGVALMEGDAEALAEGDWRAGDAMAMRSLDRPLVSGDPAARSTSSPEPAIVRINAMTAAHWRRRMSEAYGGTAAVIRL